MKTPSKMSPARFWLLLSGAVVLGGTAGWLKPVPPRTQPDSSVQTDQKSTAVQPAHVEPRGPVVSLKAEPIVHAIADGPAVYPAAPGFSEVSEGNFEAKTSQYRATLNAADGLRFFPAWPSKLEMRVRLNRVARGEKAVFDRATDPDAASDTAVDDGAGALSFWRAPGFEEHYIPRGDGVEQNFTFDEPIAGTGDLVFTCDVSHHGLTAAPPHPGRNGGISFLAAGGGAFAARYGQVVVRDSASHGISVEPELIGEKTIRFAIPETFLNTAAFPITVDPLIGGDFFITPENATGVHAPAVVAGTNNFLVAWLDGSHGTKPALSQSKGQTRLMGSIVTQAGIASAPFTISASVGVPQPLQAQRTQIAFDGSSNWLVVWSDDRSVGPGVRGAIIGTNGTLLGGSDFLIATTPGTMPELPIAAYNGTNFVVAWMSAPAGSKTGSQIYYTHILPSGTVAPPKTLPIQDAPDQKALFLAGQKPNGDTLLVYSDKAEIRGVRVAGDGTLRDRNGTLLYTRDQTPGSCGHPIGAEFVEGGWQILSTNKLNYNACGRINAQKVSTTGLVSASTIFSEWAAPPNTPIVASGGASGWIMLRDDPANADIAHVLGKRVGFDGTQFDAIPFQIDTNTQSKLSDAASDQAGDQILTVWLDTRGAETRIGGALNSVTVVSNTGPGLVPVVLMSPANGSAPASVNFDATGSTGNYDSLQWNFGDGTTSSQPIASHTYRVNGTYIAQLQLTRGAHSFYQTVEVAIGATSVPDETPHIGAPVENSFDGLRAGSADLARGSFLISKFTCQEQAAGKHTYSIKGQIARPRAGQYQLSSDGKIVLSIGKYTLATGVSKFVAQNGSIKYAAKPSASGLKKFSINQRTGVFDLQLVNIPSGGVSGSGLPLSNDHTTNVNLNLSFKLDLKDGRLDAGRYLYITRKDARGKAWKLR